ncbi:MAG: M23 family metallopeptidase [Novosphingobium sp.]|uniref:M23 family metallopeptidase n=1 Tax=Novosphingobium sp. TaxID=1874826 RepID=UPI0032B93B89
MLETMIDRRLLLAGGGLGLGLGLWQIRGLAAEAAGYDAATDFALSGQLTQGGWARGKAPASTRALSFGRRPVLIAPDRSFFIAFDRDAPGRAELLAELADGTATRGVLNIAPRAWKIERIPIGPRPGSPLSAEYARRREGETTQINAARRIDHNSEGWRQKFIWPVYGRISGRFGSQRIYNGTPGSYHSGMDIATGASGTPFVAPADGIVTLAAASSFSLEGRLLMIDHGMGLNSAFLHCSAHAVKVGDMVCQGQFIGRIGATGRATGPHLHWSVKWRDARLDPLLFVGALPGR